MPTDYDHGESLDCPACGTGYVADAERPHVVTQDDARCRVCSHVMTHWPQGVGFEMIETAEEAGG